MRRWQASVWGWLVDGVRPDLPSTVGAGIALVGAPIAHGPFGPIQSIYLRNPGGNLLDISVYVAAT